MHGNTLIAGTTYEKTWESKNPDSAVCEAIIREKIRRYSPFYADLDCVDCRSGFRVSGGNHRPIIAKITKKLWCVTGMGSKGLLHHALMGKLAAEAITSGRTDLPKEVFYNQTAM